MPHLIQSGADERRITLTRTVQERSMLPSSHPEIHEPPATGVSPRRTNRRQRQKLRNTRRILAFERGTCLCQRTSRSCARREFSRHDLFSPSWEDQPPSFLCGSPSGATLRGRGCRRRRSRVMASAAASTVGRTSSRRRPTEIELLGDRHEVPQLAQFHDPTCYVHWEGPPLTREKGGRGSSVRCGHTMNP
jgi:hypothetical protein